MKKNETIIYGALFFGIILIGVALIPFVNSEQKLDVDEKGNVLKTQKNEEIFTQQAEEINSECGDLESESNIQHLSHHPARYEKCLKQVNPELLKQATGKTLEELMK